MIALQVDGTPVRGLESLATINLVSGAGASVVANYVQPARRLDLTVGALQSGAFICGARAAVVANSYLRTINGVVMTASIGFHAPWDVEVLGIAYTKTDVLTGTLEVRDDGVMVEGLSTGASAEGSEEFSGVTLAAGHTLSVFWSSSGGSFTDGVVHVFWRRI